MKTKQILEKELLLRHLQFQATLSAIEATLTASSINVSRTRKIQKLVDQVSPFD